MRWRIRLSGANQTIAGAYASFMQARAIVREAQSQYWPTLSVGASATRSRSPSVLSSPGTLAAGTGNSFSLPFDASWTPDLWGRVRNTVNGDIAAAQASAADLANARLTAQAEVAVDYFELRSQDALIALATSTVKAYGEALELTRAQFETGIGTDEAVAQAQVQLRTTQAQLTSLGIARAQYEHAIAVLVGKPASSFSVPAAPSNVQPVAVPLGVPSQLLERRPDVAADERLMAQANAQIGVAEAAYFPTLTLSASAGFESSAASTWLTWPARFWSVGPSLSETIFDGGLRSATVVQYRAAYDAAVATYRQTVLTAFQQVEDNLASLRILSQEIGQQDQAVSYSQRYVSLATDRYKLGLDPYLDVITAQTSLFSNQQTAVSLRLRQLTASVQLIEALGGGWQSSQLPTAAISAPGRPGADRTGARVSAAKTGRNMTQLTPQELLQRYASLAGIPAGQLATDLRAGAKAISVPADTPVFEEGAACPGFPLVLEGEVRVARGSRSGRSLELYRVGAGDICVVSATGLMGERPLSAHGTTTRATRLVLLCADVFARWTADRVFRQFVFHAFAERLNDLMTTVEAVAFQRLDQRLAEYLLGHGRVLHATHQAVADEIGTVREMVSRLLNRFHAQGLVELGRGQIEIVDAVRLRRIASGEP